MTKDCKGWEQPFFFQGGEALGRASRFSEFKLGDLENNFLD
jgi:hypothetical protein